MMWRPNGVVAQASGGRTFTGQISTVSHIWEHNIQDSSKK